MLFTLAMCSRSSLEKWFTISVSDMLGKLGWFGSPQGR